MPLGDGFCTQTQNYEPWNMSCHERKTNIDFPYLMLSENEVEFI